HDGSVLITGGDLVGDPTSSVASAELFDPLTGSFTPTASKPVWARQEHLVIALPDGRALVLSGITAIDGGRTGNSQVEAFDPDTGTFDVASSEAVEDAVAILLPDGRIAVFDGRKAYQVNGNVTVYDITGRIVTSRRPLPYMVNAAVLLDD